ncbi:MAG TPA: 23S rRNA (guanosine(2251)-2'-O)-methyltransferase RlmB [Bacteroidota bacterium]|nr:23S rRNA (guanosine(2251)-2'-O)-methyltransferase RlmB [Bacteroidota bacterium]
MAEEQFIAGRQPILEALKSRQSIDHILLLHGTTGPQIQQIKQLAREQRIHVKEIDKEHFQKYSRESVTQGVLAVVNEYVYVDVEDIIAHAQKKNESPFLLVLDEIEDPHNLGALIRTAECAGVHGVIIPLHHAASVNQTVVKTSAGATAHILIARVTNIAQAIDALKKENVWIVGTDMSGGKKYYEQDYRGAIAIVIGSEGSGMRRLVKEKCDFLVSIPMHGNIESLNASVAGGLVLFEAAKARQ